LISVSRQSRAGITPSKPTNKGTGAIHLRRLSVAIRSAALRRGERPTSGSDEGT
jgi:hypothetical protein